MWFGLLVQKEAVSLVKMWPHRKLALLGPLGFSPPLMRPLSERCGQKTGGNVGGVTDCKVTDDCILVTFVSNDARYLKNIATLLLRGHRKLHVALA